MLLNVRSLVVQYGKSQALKGVSVECADKEIITLIGANGAGKTTILRTISGIKRLTSGEIWFGDERLDKISAHDVVKLGIAHIPEGRKVFSTMSVLENLEMGGYTRRSREELKQGLEYVYEHFPILKKRQKQHAGSLSGGEQQMLATARALMVRPKLLLMDEPSLGLSPLLVREVGNIIKEIQKLGVSIILVEQNARMALALADRAYVLEVGRIVLEGMGKELLCNEDVKKAYLGK
jgi:branched-chain amino acid transport system ATP-binding protein